MRTTNRRYAVALLALLLVTPAMRAHPQGAAQTRQPAPQNRPAVRVWTETVTIPTFPMGEDDPNPHFRELGGSLIYPYTMQDRFGTEPVDRSYRAAFLENEYLRIMVLPEIGGRIQSVFDKVTGEEMFYRNNVIRPGHIALRGAWVSGGVEWNRGPQGHTVTSFSPVNVLPHQSPDGSASLLIGATEQVTRTGWEVRLTLQPGVRALDEQIRLFNPTDGMHPYYFWNNTAFPERPGTRFIFPMSLGTDHEGTSFFAWPIHEGRDLSWLRNHPGPTSIFGVEVPFDFFGAYDADRDFGVVQFANHRMVPGKKAWTWGQSDAAQRAQSVLTESDGNYIEVQSGPLPTQSDYGLLAPGQEISWQERWYPVNDLGEGFEYATADAVIGRLDHAGAVELRLAVNRELIGANLDIYRQDGRVDRRLLNLSPARTESFRVEVPAAAGQEIPRMRIRLETAEGIEVLDYRSPLKIPERTPATSPATTTDSSESLYLAAERLDRALDRAGARRGYEAALAIDPLHTRSLLGLAVLDLEAARYMQAADRFERALALNDADGMAWYQLGVARLQLGDLQGASDAGAQSLKRAGTAALGHGLIGRARALDGDFQGALESFTNALAAGGSDWTRLFERIVLGTYGLGQTQAAVNLSQQANRSGSLRLLTHVLPALASERGLSGTVRRVSEWLAEPEFEFLEVSVALGELGLFRDAVNLLEAWAVASTAAAKRSPLPLYYMAWYSDRLGEDAQVARWLQQAREVTGRHVFPSRAEAVPVLELAVDRMPDHGPTWEILGNLYAGLGRVDDARTAWQRAADLDPTLSIARRGLGLAAWHIDADLEAAGRWLSAARDATPQDLTLARDLGRVLMRAGRFADAAAALTPASLGPDRRADAIVLLAQCHVELGQYDEAIALLGGMTFTSREGDVGTRGVFVDAHVGRGRGSLDAGNPAAALTDFETALTYPENLNVGRPHLPREAQLQFWRAQALDALGRPAEAREALEECAAGALLDAEQREFAGRCREALAR